MISSILLFKEINKLEKENIYLKKKSYHLGLLFNKSRLINKKGLIGKLKQDNIHYGRLFYDNNKTKYIGYFNKNNKFEGEGEFFLNNENNTIYYKGYHKNGLPNGKGTVYYENGNRHYVGNIKNGYFHGEGLEYYEDGQLMYNGTFKYGEKNGKGIFFLKIMY